MRVALLKGGMSAERDVSLSSGAAVEKALLALGHEVVCVDAQSDLAQKLTDAKPDVVFNALHGRWGEDGCVQGVLEILKIPYTHSGVLASALAMDKPMAKKIFEAEGIRCAHGVIVSRASLKGGDPLPRPYVLKPLNEGSSVGVIILHEGDNLQLEGLADELLCETYIAGREIQVAVMDGKALGAIEIKPLSGFYDYEAKYTDGKAEHLMPAPIDDALYSEVCELAERAHNALGCRGLTRTDFRLDATSNQFYILEVNTQPGMTPLSLAPEIAAHKGISFNDLVAQLIAGAALDG